jgi:hypothetical protein
MKILKDGIENSPMPIVNEMSNFDIEMSVPIRLNV